MEVGDKYCRREGDGVYNIYCGRVCGGSSIKKPQPKNKKGGTPVKLGRPKNTVKYFFISFYRERKIGLPFSGLINRLMRTQNTQAKHVSAGFGYSHVMVGNTHVYTTKIRTKQFDLLRYAIEHYRRNENKLAGTWGQIKMNKNGRKYVTYEFVSTDFNAMIQFRKEMDEARAEVLDVQSARLKMRNPWYEPIWMTTIREQLYREECNALGDPKGTTYDDLDLPF